jgi:glycosyltransferase involved in cell wall biosynthesis
MENNEQPLISVVIPVYNEEVRITRAIQCILDQTYKNLEIIVVDDHSTDGTAQAIKAMAAKHANVTYHLLPGGAPKRTNWRGYDINAGWKARAYGFTIARGGWITTQDADDASLLNRIEVEYWLAQKYNATMVSVTWMECSDERLSKTFDVEGFFKAYGEDRIVVGPGEIQKVVEACTGPIMRLPFHHLIPFPIKWFPWTRRLFWGTYHNYPGGSDNNLLFRREVIAAGVNVRTRNERTWGVPSGRGSGRDFAMHTAHVFKNNWAFKIPLYLWDVHSENNEFLLEGFKHYLQ